MTEQRFAFDAMAANYDAFRPDYPDALFADLAKLAPPEQPILEVGCGTGKATEGLARLGRPITAVEPGAAMIAAARRRTAGAPVRFVQSTFEDWAPQGAPFGMIASAQAWHWVDPAVGFAKAASLLVDDGILAVFGNVEVELPPALERAVEAAYAQIRPAQGIRQGGGAYRPGEFTERLLSSAHEFESPGHRVYERVLTYTPARYVGVTATYSDIQMQPTDVRNAFLATLHQALSAHGANFEVKMEAHLYWARPKR